MLCTLSGPVVFEFFNREMALRASCSVKARLWCLSECSFRMVLVVVLFCLDVGLKLSGVVFHEGVTVLFRDKNIEVV